MGLRCIVMGSAAGGGFPQWNCACALCARARAGDPVARPRSQVQLAVTADDQRFLLVGASPDLRQQILATPALQPRAGLRDSPIAAVVLASADVDGIAGLLVLREQQAFTLFAAQPTLDILAANGVFGVLDPALVRRVPVTPLIPIDTVLGMRLTLLPMPGKVPLYAEDRAAAVPEAAAAYAARIEAAGRCVVIAPSCARVDDAVLQRLADTDALLFDGTVFEDDEMVRAGVGTKTGARMGHLSIAGPSGSMARLAGLPARRIYVHINNTNPILLDDSAERRTVEQAGFEVAFDGMEIVV